MLCYFVPLFKGWLLLSLPSTALTRLTGTEFTVSSVEIGSVTWTRTRDNRINSAGLYQLSYHGTNWLREQDLNLRSLGYEPSEDGLSSISLQQGEACCLEQPSAPTASNSNGCSFALFCRLACFVIGGYSRTRTWDVSMYGFTVRRLRRSTSSTLNFVSVRLFSVVYFLMRWFYNKF